MPDSKNPSSPLQRVIETLKKSPKDDNDSHLQPRDRYRISIVFALADFYREALNLPKDWPIDSPVKHKCSGKKEKFKKFWESLNNLSKGLINVRKNLFVKQQFFEARPYFPEEFICLISAVETIYASLHGLDLPPVALPFPLLDEYWEDKHQVPVFKSYVYDKHVSKGEKSMEFFIKEGAFVTNKDSEWSIETLESHYEQIRCGLPPSSKRDGKALKDTKRNKGRESVECSGDHRKKKGNETRDDDPQSSKRDGKALIDTKTNKRRESVECYTDHHKKKRNKRQDDDRVKKRKVGSSVLDLENIKTRNDDHIVNSCVIQKQEQSVLLQGDNLRTCYFDIINRKVLKVCNGDSKKGMVVMVRDDDGGTIIIKEMRKSLNYGKDQIAAHEIKQCNLLHLKGIYVPDDAPARHVWCNAVYNKSANAFCPTDQVMFYFIMRCVGSENEDPRTSHNYPKVYDLMATQDGFQSIISIILLRAILGVTDTNFSNILFDEDKLYSVDENYIGKYSCEQVLNKLPVYRILNKAIEINPSCRLEDAIPEYLKETGDIRNMICQRLRDCLRNNQIDDGCIDIVMSNINLVYEAILMRLDDKGCYNKNPF